jgi:hypothetical protein
MKTKFFYTDLYTQTAAPALMGMEKAIEEAMRLRVTDIVVCVPQLSSLSNTFAEAFGEDLADALGRKGLIHVRGLTFYLWTKRKKLPRLSNVVVFGVEIKPEEIDQLLQKRNVVALIYMPLHQTEMDTFRKQYPSAEHIVTEDSNK